MPIPIVVVFTLMMAPIFIITACDLYKGIKKRIKRRKQKYRHIRIIQLE